jgi:hypothetical protein
MSTATVFRAACTGLQRDVAGNSVRGGTLRVLSADHAVPG